MTRWDNAGSLGSSWDLDGVVGEGHIFQEAGAWMDSAGPCLLSHNSSMLFMTAPATEMTATVVCVAMQIPLQPRTDVFLQWSSDLPDHNLLRGLPTLDETKVEYRGGGRDFEGAMRGMEFPAEYVGVEAICLDLSDPAAIRHSVSGRRTEPVFFADQSGPNFRHASRFTVGGELSERGLGVRSSCEGCAYHRIVAYDGLPDRDLRELSQCLFDQWTEEAPS